jgi:hypothetical protein
LARKLAIGPFSCDSIGGFRSISALYILESWAVALIPVFNNEEVTSEEKKTSAGTSGAGTRLGGVGGGHLCYAPLVKSAKKDKVKNLAKKRGPTFATQPEENAVVEWLIGVPSIYDKEDRQHKNSTVVARVWAEKAELLKMDPAMLKTWYKSCRSQYSKVMREE